MTIATNMAGRGVDIKLGGNAEHLTQLELAKLGLQPGDPDYDERFAEVLPTIEARIEADREKVLEAGGLFICGTERHESRRIDNQLRGRSGRQGDPGESRFFLSAEDDLVRLFAGDRIYRILDRLGPDEEGEEEPIEAKMLSKQIEKAQRKVEEQNFLIRKRVLEYDDVMNQQREIVYKYRDEVLEGRDMGAQAREQIGRGHRAPGRRVHARRLHRGLGPRRACGSSSTRSSRSTSAPTSSTASRSTARSSSACSATTRSKLYDEREEELGEELMRALERYLLLQIIDQRWREHLYDMDYLREGIHLRGFAQIDPLVAYKNEAFTLFQDLMNTIWSDFARMIYNVEVEVEGENGHGESLSPAGSSTGGGASFSYSGGTLDDQPSRLRRRRGAAGGRAGAGPAAPRRRERADRAQRPVLVRVGQEVQEVPRRVRRRANGRTAETICLAGQTVDAPGQANRRRGSCRPTSSRSAR